MGQPVQSIIECTVVGKLSSQTTMSVYHYYVGGVSTINNPQAEQVDFLNSFNAGGTGPMVLSYLDCVPGNWTLQYITAQFIRPTRYVRSRQNLTASGLRPDANQANLQASITVTSDFAGRREVGGKRLPMSSDDSIAGFLIAGYKAALSGHAAEMKQNVTGTAGGGVYTPCIFHRNPVPNSYSPLTNAFAQDTTRVIRRRTVGLGI